MADTADTLKHVGVREFRERLSDYLDARTPVAVTRHGRTVGYYIPAQRHADEAERDALRQAAARLQEALERHGVDVEEVVQTFRAKRRDP